jgi:DNA-binding NarL/FixJ family response regulator
MLTMYSDQRSEAMAAVVDAFLLKGCGVEVLLNAIQS